MVIPIRAAAGEADMPDFIAGADEVAQALPQAEVVSIAGAGHLAPLETPEEFSALLLGFLDRLRR
jgi:pimeloyl-ACP methyl ester carboxylesterase